MPNGRATQIRAPGAMFRLGSYSPTASHRDLILPSITTTLADSLEHPTMSEPSARRPSTVSLNIPLFDSHNTRPTSPTGNKRIRFPDRKFSREEERVRFLSTEAIWEPEENGELEEKRAVTQTDGQTDGAPSSGESGRFHLAPAQDHLPPVIEVPEVDSNQSTVTSMAELLRQNRDSQPSPTSRGGSTHIAERQGRDSPSPTSRGGSTHMVERQGRDAPSPTSRGGSTNMAERQGRDSPSPNSRGGSTNIVERQGRDSQPSPTSRGGSTDMAERQGKDSEGNLITAGGSTNMAELGTNKSPPTDPGTSNMAEVGTESQETTA